jgi:hypothetical protein
MKATKRNSTVNTGWSGADHLERDASRDHKLTSEQHRRRDLLSHDTKDKRDAMKLKLHLTKSQRAVDDMKKRLQVWDAQEEKKQAIERKRLEDLAAADDGQPKKKRGRLGPETWKLKGPARPAWEVYDFDVRYVDPHIEAHKQAKEKATRCVNLLLVHKGKFGHDAAPETAREYLGLLMQLGHISVEAKKYKTAREAWLECIELEGDDPITTARESLMRMYLDLKRYDAAYRLGERLADDPSVWIRYSYAVMALQQKKPDADIEKCMVSAIQANPFCAYYLAFYDTFNGVMEYTEDLAESEDEPQSSLEEAIEYCSSETVPMWLDSKANITLRNILVSAAQGNHRQLKPSDLEWSTRLTKIEEECDRIAMEAALKQVNDENEEAEEEEEDDANEERPDSEEEVLEEEKPEGRKRKARRDEDEDESEEEDDEEEVEVDVRMYAGMFRTAMEMLQESGQLGVMPK